MFSEHANPIQGERFTPAAQGPTRFPRAPRRSLHTRKARRLHTNRHRMVIFDHTQKVERQRCATKEGAPWNR